ncbi:hypothetical protein MVEN_01378100 [Mycena venus]|uniref:F-box domain-containing protein n=1 Tax=Mycena venus TaxID=2733690 RepID=A0A8H6XUX2_9AGAR|nr:hypothetical protein MVEN_01378100 [Mycena venus]
MDPAGPAGSLPPELWLHIYRLATSESSPLAVANADRFQYLSFPDPFKDIKHYLRDAYSFVLVCKSWNTLANEILYENIQIRVDRPFQVVQLCTSLKRRPDTARLVRSILLSPTGFDVNYTFLSLCPRLQLVVQPDASNSDTRMLVTGPDLEEEEEEMVDGGYLTAAVLLRNNISPLPQFHSLKHIYWTESSFSSLLLRKLVRLTPNLEYLFLTQSSTIRELVENDFPALPSVRRLGLVSTGGLLTYSVFKLDLHNLTRFQCSPSYLHLEELPTLPLLRTLELFGSRSSIPFDIIFSRFPRLQELCYDVWNGLTGVQNPCDAMPLSCIRLHSAVSVIRDWTPVEGHFAMFVSPGFPRNTAARVARKLVPCRWH